MRKLYYDLLIDGKPILTPDSDMQIELNDLEHSDSGRDESGYTHRLVLRRDMKTVTPNYTVLTLEEYAYMESLFQGKDTVLVTYTGLNGRKAVFEAYRLKHSIVIHDAKKGIVKNYKFNLIEC